MLTSINSLPDKRAQTIAAQTPEPGNFYLESVVAAAQHLVREGRPEWHYLTQYISGTTLWRDEQGKAHLIERKELHGPVSE